MAMIVRRSAEFESNITSVERLIEYQNTPHEVKLRLSLIFVYIFGSIKRSRGRFKKQSLMKTGQISVR
jgi:hypothetical protein